MATLIPEPNALVARKTPGKHRPAERREQTSDDIRLNASQWDGHAWGDAAILCVDTRHRRTLPFNVRQRSGEFNPAVGTIQIMTMKVSKGLEFPVVVLPGVGRMSAKGEDEKEATWATQRLVIGVGEDGVFANQMNE